MKGRSGQRKIAAAFLGALIFVFGIGANVIVAAAGEESTMTENIPGAALTGGGYAATGQIDNVGYASEIYDATNGLPTSDANFILGASNGFIWIGSYSGIIRYDGTTFERMDTSDGLTNGRGLFEDSKGRIWVATNDNGVVVIDGVESMHFTYKDGLPSSSIRVFAEDKEGDIYIGTTAGVCYVNPQMELFVIDDERINEERVLKLDSDQTGRIYGQTKNGIIFLIEDHKVSEVYESDALGMGKITTILADPLHDGKIYLGSENDVIYYGNFGDDVSRMRQISVAPVKNVHWLNFDCGRVWVSSETVAGYLDENEHFCVLSDIPMDSAIEMITSDYQGNLWFASSTQGVMKVVTDNFVNLSKKAGLPEAVTNTTCLHEGKLYIGTDNGIFIIDEEEHRIEKELNVPAEKALARKTNVLITINREDYERARTRFHADKVAYVPGVGLHLNRFALHSEYGDEVRKSLEIGENDFLIKLEEITHPDTYILFYVWGGQSATVGVPIGTYSLKYASGRTGYGLIKRFGNPVRALKNIL